MTVYLQKGTFMREKHKETQNSNTFLGEDSSFEGDMKFLGSVTIEGVFKGNITGEGVVTVGRYGDLYADIHASKVKIYGTIRGHILAENEICVYSSGKIFGDIEAPNLQVQKGAFLKGNCNTHKLKKLNDEDIY